ncbi:6063_t:CDS:10 [Funneliformis caledonium]|uniref:6063_t:CDS:1 n=1 Tax=Funneliformis caledonium TaxID=1117310 RepID=A0A9N8ZU91_9GLOM|nr:6063_t:CDS:10 [Funneliformis caledonium]
MDRLRERHNPYPERKPLSNVNIMKCKVRGRGKSLRVPGGNMPFDRNPQFRGLQPPSPFWDESKTFEPSQAPMFDFFVNGNGPGVQDNNVKFNKNDPAFLEARLALERPCRTLFIRNIQYGTKTELVRSKFEEYGEIRDIFDIIEKRGMLFLSFYDIRASEKAKVEMQNYEFGGRKIDVHYSLPKENEEMIYCDRDKNQGTLFITLKEGKAPLDNDALIHHFSQFGEVKVVREYRTHPNQRFVEFWDSRACTRAHDATLNAEYNGGHFDCKFAWDVSAKQRAGNIINRLSIGNELLLKRPADINNFERIPFHEHADENFVNRSADVEDFLNRLSPQLLAGEMTQRYHENGYPSARDVHEYSPENGYNGAAFPSPQSSQHSSPQNQRVTPQTQFSNVKTEPKSVIDFGPLSETERLEQANKVQQMISMIAATQLAQVTAQAQVQSQPQAQTQVPHSNVSLYPGLVGIPQMQNHATYTPVNCTTMSSQVAPVLNNTVYNNALGITPGVNPVVNPAFLNAIVNEISAGHNHQTVQAANSDKNHIDTNPNMSQPSQRSNTIRVNELLALLVQKQQIDANSVTLQQQQQHYQTYQQNNVTTYPNPYESLTPQKIQTHPPPQQLASFTNHYDPSSSQTSNQQTSKIPQQSQPQTQQTVEAKQTQY